MPARKRREPTAVDLPAAVLGRIVGSAVLAVGTIPAPRFVETHNSYSAQSSDTEYWQRIHDDAAGRQVPKDTRERRQGMSIARLDVVHAARRVCRYWRDCVDYSLVDYVYLTGTSAPKVLSLVGCQHAHLIEGPLAQWTAADSIPLNFGSMSRLKSLVLDSEHLKELPRALAMLPLTELWLNCPMLGPWLESAAASSTLPASLRSVAFGGSCPVVKTPFPICLRKLVNLTDLDINSLGRVCQRGVFHDPKAPGWLSELPLRRFTMYEVTDASSLTFTTELSKLSLTSLNMEVDDARSDNRATTRGVSM